MMANTLGRALSVPLFILTILFNFSCSGTGNDLKTQNDSINNSTASEITVACYYFPNWGPVESSEWTLLQKATPKFEGHQQPKVPLWGYENENDPKAMAKKIDAAADNGIDAFIFDWYYTDSGKYLESALESGFLKASNNPRMKFSLMWCNHDLGKLKGAVKPETFDKIADYVIEKYFKHPSYWKIKGAPYFSIYQFDTFLETFGNDTAKAFNALDRFRKKVKAAGFPDLHLNGCLWGLKGSGRDQTIKRLGINSTTSYVWIHHNALPDFPATDYIKSRDAYFNAVYNGGGANGLETVTSSLAVPYYPNVSMGWDSSPRCGDVTSEYWQSNKTPYPFGAVIVNNTPFLFKEALLKAKEYVSAKPAEERIIVVNSWNEWGEGSYLEPDTINKYEYLNAIRAVFK